MNRIGSVAIIIEGNKQSIEQVNQILSAFSQGITARMGVPNHEKNIFVISLIVEMSNEELGAMTGKLGNLPDVSVKSLLTGKTY